MYTQTEMSHKDIIPSARTCTEELDELIIGHIKKSVQIHASETELLERSLLRQSCRRRHRNISIAIRLLTSTKKHAVKTTSISIRKTEELKSAGGRVTMVRAGTGEINNCECEERLPLDLMPLGFFFQGEEEKGFIRCDFI